jgi:hypothetical protein
LNPFPFKALLLKIGSVEALWGDKVGTVRCLVECM